MNAFPFEKPQLSKGLPLNLKLTEKMNNKAIKNKAELRKRAQEQKNYIHDYTNTIGITGKWYMSEKLDGIRAIWDGKFLRTRSMRKFTYVPEWFLKELPVGTALDGEIYIQNKPFQYFSSLSVTKQSPVVDDKWEEVTYCIFDLPNKIGTFEERMYRLKRLKIFNNPKLKNQFLKMVHFTEYNDIRKDFYKVNENFKQITSSGGEGLMLIKADSYYEGRRVKHSLKYKKEYSGEAEIIGLYEGMGKYYKKLGKFKCKIPTTSKTFFCGTGLTDELRCMYHFDRTECLYIDDNTNTCNAPRIGDTITYNCMEILPSGIPRMSVYKGIRTDL